MIEYVNHSGNTIALVSNCAVNSAQDALDIMAEVYFEGCDRMIVQKDMLPESFFSLKSGLAGEILQKFSNYNMKLAIIGDFKNVKKSLSDFIYESNRGNRVFFKKTIKEALEALSRI